jgi:chromosome segregation ATPase
MIKKISRRYCIFSSSRESKPVKITSKVVKKPSNDTSTSKLIAALEAEEKRLKNNELKYAERIKALTTELQAEKAKAVEYQNLKVLYAELKQKDDNISPEYSKLIDQHEKLRNEFVAARQTLQDYEHQIPRLKNTIAELENSSKFLKNDLEKANKDCDGLRVALEQKTTELQKKTADLDQFSAITGLKLLQAKENAKLKLLEYKKDNELLKEHLDQAKRELNHLRDEMHKKDDQNSYKMERMIDAHKREVEDAVSNAKLLLQEQHKTQMQSLQDSLKQSSQAYQVLEQEFLKGVNIERTRKKEVEAMLKESKAKEKSLRAMVDKLNEKEREYTNTISNLVTVAKEQKLEITRLEQRGSTSINALQQQLKDTEEKLGASETKRRDLEAKADYLKSIRPKIERLEEDYRLLHSKHQKLIDENSSYKLENENLRNQCQMQRQEMERGRDDVQTATKDLRDALKVKDSMLDDQNETIKTLKVHLENKTREFQVLTKELDQYKQELELVDERYERTINDMKEQVLSLDIDGTSWI